MRIGIPVWESIHKLPTQKVEESTFNEMINLGTFYDGKSTKWLWCDDYDYDDYEYDYDDAHSRAASDTHMH